MTSSFSAIYRNAANESYQASIVLSTVTLSIIFDDGSGHDQQVHWLGSDIQQLEYTTSGYILHYRSPAGENASLHFSDLPLLEAIKKNFRHQKFTGNRPARTFNSFVSKVLLFLGIFCGLFLIVYLWVAPWLGEKVATNFSKETEISIGEKMFQATISGDKIDTAKTTLVNDFYRQLGYKTDYPIQITVVKNPLINAYAVPGGRIVVFDGILDNMKTPEELAALLAHEASHVALRHSLRNIFRSLARQMFLSLVIGSESGITSVLVSNADHLKELEYSRELETEADNNGVKLMHENHIDTKGMEQLMKMMEKEAGSEAGSVNFLSTHPVFDKRIANIQEQLKAYPPAPTQNQQLKQIFHAIYENY